MFSLFTFKSDLQKVFTPENLDKLKDFTIGKIVYYVDKELLGVEKKQKVTALVVAFIAQNFVSKNSIVNFFIQLLIQFTPSLVQYLYDSLKKYVSGLTEVRED